MDKKDISDLIVSGDIEKLESFFEEGKLYLSEYRQFVCGVTNYPLDVCCCVFEKEVPLRMTVWLLKKEIYFCKICKICERRDIEKLNAIFEMMGNVAKLIQ